MLAGIHTDIAAKFAFICEMQKDLKIKKAEFWGKKFDGDKPLSDTYLEAQWNLTKEGKEELKIKYEMIGLEKHENAIKSALIAASLEARNIA